eukprot:snap_masked-scaffold747_size103044-processed-gene-0.3 protein:Tk12098 transcript:snap_masked-scaffold747_size103044-processed-gene-0.3-mRNA-1 annotation:"dehydrodolichyl diphosphate synthase isoform x2"
MAAQSPDHRGSGVKDGLLVRIRQEVNVALPEALVRVLEVHLFIGHHLEAGGQKLHRLGAEGQFSGLGSSGKAGDREDISAPENFDLVVEVALKVLAADLDLDLVVQLVDVEEYQLLAHQSNGVDPAREAATNLGEALGLGEMGKFMVKRSDGAKKRGDFQFGTMSWVPEKKVNYSFWESLALRLLRFGVVPKHVAFIMDGNRRFAKVNQLEQIQGHVHGFDKLAETLQWCHDIGIKEVTVYAFSIENFKRPQREVDGILDLARDKFRRLLSEQEKLKEHGIRVRVIGNIKLLPDDLKELIDQAEKATEANSERILNVAFSYTSREEIAQAVRKCAQGVEDGHILSEDITEDLIERCLYTNISGTVDLLIRTSGEVRLSDFLLWQSSYSVIYFEPVLWPDFSFKNLLAGVFYFQRHQRQLHSMLAKVEAHQPPSFKSEEHIDELERCLRCLGRMVPLGPRPITFGSTRFTVPLLKLLGVGDSDLSSLLAVSELSAEPELTPLELWITILGGPVFSLGWGRDLRTSETMLPGPLILPILLPAKLALSKQRLEAKIEARTLL